MTKNAEDPKDLVGRKASEVAGSGVLAQVSARPRLARMARKKTGDPKAEFGPLGPMPAQTNAELAQAIVRAGLSVVPAGGAVAELLALLQPAFGRRRDAWLQQLADAVQELKARPEAPTFDELSKNELFVTVVFNATQAAQRTHQKEKIEALRAAVMNSVLPTAPGEQEQLMFIRLIDELTPLHLQILSFMRDPAGWFEKQKIPKPDVNTSNRPLILVSAFPDLGGSAEVFSLAMSELVTLGLTGYGLMTVETPLEQLLEKLTTSLGDRFLDFITAPWVLAVAKK